jgi:hypothetical protein
MRSLGGYTVGALSQLSGLINVNVEIIRQNLENVGVTTREDAVDFQRRDRVSRPRFLNRTISRQKRTPANLTTPQIGSFAPTQALRPLRISQPGPAAGTYCRQADI